MAAKELGRLLWVQMAELRTSEEQELAAVVMLTDLQDWGACGHHAGPFALIRHCEMSTWH